MTELEIKKAVTEKATELGAAMAGVAPAERWRTAPMQKSEFHPLSIWPWCKNVIVMAVPLYLPMIASTPSMVYQELYDTTNRVLDDIAYKLAGYITAELGYRAMYFPRDCYYDINTLLDKPEAAFSHVIAGYYAGLGTIGDSRNLITKEFGPRVRLVSVITDAPMPADDMIGEDLCLHCGKCARECPSGCFSQGGGSVYDMDKDACTKYHIELKKQKHWPCGVCAGVCPVGEDARLYRGTKPISEEGKEHCRYYGS